MSNEEFSLFANFQEIINRKSLIETIDKPNAIDIFNIFNSTTNNENNNLIDLNNIKNYEKSHTQLFPLKLKDKLYISLNRNDNKVNRTNFFNDSFFHDILSSTELKESFENINANKNFIIKSNEVISNSSIYFCYPILKELEKDNKMKKVAEKLEEQIKSLNPIQKENIPLISSICQVPKEINNIKYFRKVKANGDSFYISFIYQYIRKIISQGDVSIITHILNLDKEYHILNPSTIVSVQPGNIGDVYIKETESLNSSDLKYLAQAFSYLGIIYSFLTANKSGIKDAINMYDLAFAYDKIFGQLLCLFMKSNIKNFLSKNSDKFNKDEYYLKNKLIPENYFAFGNKFNYESYIKDILEINQTEPSLFIISIVPYIFNVTLNLYINEKGTNNPEDGSQLIKLVLNPDKNMDINILYTSYSYHIIESDIDKDIPKDNIKIKVDICNILNYTRQGNEDIEKYKNEYIMKFQKEEECIICKKNEYIIILNISKAPICFTCFKTMVENVLIQRYHYMLKERFNFIEYYLKEIPLLYQENTNDYIYLSSTEFFCIFNKNLFTYFQDLINNICDLCGEYIKDKKIVHKKCGCKYCLDCAKKECGKTLYFNKFEKNIIYKDSTINCKCGTNINKLDYASQIYNMLYGEEKISYEKEAEKRINDYISKYCMLCGIKLGKNVIGSQKKNYFKCVVDFDLNKSNLNNEHILCEICYKQSMNNKDILCIICDIRHTFKDKLDKSKISKKNNQSKHSINRDESQNIKKAEDEDNKEEIKNKKIEENKIQDNKEIEKNKKNKIQKEGSNKKLKIEIKENKIDIKNKVKDGENQKKKEESNSGKDFKKSEEEISNKKAGQINKINSIDNKSSQSNRNTSNSEQKENEFGKSSDSRNNNSNVATDGKDKKNRIGCISCKGESCIIY